eukprot:708871-Prorocentrum_lima.AAC.1
MTSSLVGSEMCIRDRKHLECELLARAPPFASVPPKSDLAPALACCLSPVSYTHLTLPTICSV